MYVYAFTRLGRRRGRGAQGAGPSPLARSPAVAAPRGARGAHGLRGPDEGAGGRAGGQGAAGAELGFGARRWEAAAPGPAACKRVLRGAGRVPQREGGILKTSKEADAESLQAGWFPRTSLATPLRAHDIVHLLELGAQYLQQAWHPPLLPQELPCSVVCQRLIAVFIGVQTLWVLVGTAGTPHLPVTACDFTPAEQRGGLKVAVLRLLQECLALHTLTVEPKGLLGLQHLGKDGSDGICLDVLVAVAFHNAGVPAEEPPKVRGENYAWWKVADEDLQSQLRQRLRDCSVVPLNR
ncbi:8-oxo-dGDP phosphatase NUDT18-like [Ochotona curzoniae]|uniref:8-oxo-dGDP phosphatase NUDT18-like n=1 Tax=Ochotona curzoniae TaxID=130825 RepID=UPI001B3489B6|nr:8-oxo-dGDP phosphatase NUDT18-like [Ochotona curzoniae]